MIRVVVDTNVIVSALIALDGLPAAILDLILQGEVVGGASQPLLEELERVLRRPAFDIGPRKIGSFLSYLRSHIRIVTPSRALTICSKDPADNRVLECAEAFRADFLVTGNKAHFPKQYQRTKVVSPREFWEEYLLHRFP